MAKLTLILLKIKKSIPRTIFMLKLANNKVFSKNRDFPSLSFTKKVAITIPKVSSLDLLIFWALTFICWTWKPSFSVTSRYIAFILLPKSIKAYIKYWPTYTGYWIQRKYYSSYSKSDMFGKISIPDIIINMEIVECKVVNLW